MIDSPFKSLSLSENISVFLAATIYSPPHRPESAGKKGIRKEEWPIRVSPSHISAHAKVSWKKSISFIDDLA